MSTTSTDISNPLYRSVNTDFLTSYYAISLLAITSVAISIMTVMKWNQGLTNTTRSCCTTAAVITGATTSFLIYKRVSNNKSGLGETTHHMENLSSRTLNVKSSDESEIGRKVLSREPSDSHLEGEDIIRPSKRLDDNDYFPLPSTVNTSENGGEEVDGSKGDQVADSNNLSSKYSDSQKSNVSLISPKSSNATAENVDDKTTRPLNPLDEERRPTKDLGDDSSPRSLSSTSSSLKSKCGRNDGGEEVDGSEGGQVDDPNTSSPRTPIAQQKNDECSLNPRRSNSTVKNVNDNIRLLTPKHKSKPGIDDSSEGEEEFINAADVRKKP